MSLSRLAGPDNAAIDLELAVESGQTMYGSVKVHGLGNF
jgi:hypothetical protein